jgi:hypothetical protein
MPLTPADAPVAHEHEDPVPRASRPASADVPWFLPAGRAGLAPESLAAPDEAAAEPDTAPARALPETAANIVSSPPWASEPVSEDLAAPPPWESGPWPSRRQDEEWIANGGQAAAAPASGPAVDGSGPGDGQDTGAGPASDRAGTATAPGAGPDGAGGRAPARAVGWPSAGAAGEPGEAVNPFAMPALVAGIAGVLVLPGLILGALGVRNGRVTRAGLLRSWLGIALSLVWAVAIIIVALPGPSRAADPGCTAYQGSTRSAVQQVSSALASGASGSQLRGGLSQAVGKVNSAAARARDVTVRSALSAMTGDLQSSLSEVAAGRQVPPALRTSLSSDISAAAHACG